MSKHGDINCCPTVETKADGTNWLEKTHESYNNYYKTYYAAWCRKSGIADAEFILLGANPG